jgi:hypothetical protein
MSVPAFALHDLGWSAFQQLCHTVVREVLGQTVVSFLDSNDAGRDGAFCGVWARLGASSIAGQFVVQCKHSARAGSNLTRSGLDDELAKASELVRDGRCDVYVMMTNMGVSGRSEKAIDRALRDVGVKDTLILGATWLNQIIAESSRLRRLVPRLYGLGDLTQILDERAYSQARAVLDAMRTDLSKLVLTGSYGKGAEALGRSGFVLLIGPPASGKTTIAAQLALGAADEFDTAVVKLDTIEELKDRWNPDDKQLFWLDDAFGPTQFDRSLARSWTLALPRITAAVNSGGLFIVTSRDYVFRAAREQLKPGAFPLLNESQVVVDVADLTVDERRHILYNHLRHGRQLAPLLTAIEPHLDFLAEHPGFSPELARRLGDPAFTAGVDSSSRSSVDRFFAHPSAFLHDVMAGLDAPSKAALGLIFINHNWVASPIHLSRSDEDLLARLGSDLGGVTSSLRDLDGSLVHNLPREGQHGWVFAHPTMVDAYSELLRSPELVHHFLMGFPIDVLLREVTCGDVGVRGALVVQEGNYPTVLDRLDEPLPRSWDLSWRARSRRSLFLASRCDRVFLSVWMERHPEAVDALADPGLMLEAAEDNLLVVRLNDLGLFAEPHRFKFAQSLINLCVTGRDPAVLWNERLRSVLTPDEGALLRSRVLEELLRRLPDAVQFCTEGWSSSNETSPESAVDPLRTLVYELPREFPDLPEVASAANVLDGLLDDWVSSQDWDEPERRERHDAMEVEAPTGAELARSDRSVFDDLLIGR